MPILAERLMPAPGHEQCGPHRPESGLPSKAGFSHSSALDQKLAQRNTAPSAIGPETKNHIHFWKNHIPFLKNALTRRLLAFVLNWPPLMSMRKQLPFHST
jgi:hypothetical protein